MSERRDKAFLTDTLKAIRRIRAYTAGMTFERFLQDAVVRNLGIIGEAMKRLSEVSFTLIAKYSLFVKIKRAKQASPAQTGANGQESDGALRDLVPSCPPQAGAPSARH